MLLHWGWICVLLRVYSGSLCDSKVFIAQNVACCFLFWASCCSQNGIQFRDNCEYRGDVCRFLNFFLFFSQFFSKVSIFLSKNQGLILFASVLLIFRNFDSLASLLLGISTTFIFVRTVGILSSSSIECANQWMQSKLGNSFPKSSRDQVSLFF